MSKVRLGDVCTEIFAGGDVPKDRFSEVKTEEYSVPIYANAEKDRGLYGYTDKARVFDDCVTVAARGTIGFTAIRREPFLPVVRLITVIPKQDIISLEYLYYALMNCQPKSSGTSIPQLTVPDIKGYTINLVSLEKQQEIVARLDKVTDLISLRKQQLTKLDELVKARFVELFGDPYINDKNWMVDTLGNYMTTLTDFSANGSYELLDSNVVMYDEPNYAIMVRTTDLESGDLSSGVKYIDESAYELLSKSKLFGGELIMNKIGSAGKIYIMPYIDCPASLGRNAFMFRFDDRLNMKYLYFLLTSDYGTKEIQQYVRGAVTKTITKESTRAIKIIVPPIELQNQFATFVEQTDKSKLAIQKSLDELETLKKALMQEYFG